MTDRGNITPKQARSNNVRIKMQRHMCYETATFWHT